MSVKLAKAGLHIGENDFCEDFDGGKYIKSAGSEEEKYTKQ